MEPPLRVRPGWQMLAGFAGLTSGVTTALLLEPRSGVPVLAGACACLGLFLIARIAADQDVSEPWFTLLLAGWTFTFSLLLFGVGGFIRPRRITRDLDGAIAMLIVVALAVAAAIVAPAAAIVAGFKRAARPGGPVPVPETRPVPARASGAGLHLAIAAVNAAAPLIALVLALVLLPTTWRIVVLAALIVVWPPLSLATSALGYRAALSRWAVRELPPLTAAIHAIQERTGVSFARVLAIDAAYLQGRVCLVVGVPRAPTLAMSESLATNLPPDQLMALVAHEAAHVRFRHLSRRMAWAGLIAVLTVAAMAALLTFIEPLFPGKLRPVGFAVAFFPILVARELYDRFVSRRQEAEADRFAVEVAGADALIGGLEALQGLGPPPPLMHNRWTTHSTWDVRAARIRAVTATLTEAIVARRR